MEKTLIDFVYFKVAIPKDILEEMKKRLDGNKLQRYLEKLDKGLRIKTDNLLIK